jgi:pimeloyl-ACP methyl ester carboxylesterase
VDVVLIAGLWLPRSIWAGVNRELERQGHRPMPVALPGVDDASAAATLDDQLEASLAVVDAANRPMVVGHSAASTLAWMIADNRPDAIEQVVMVGGFPASDGQAYADIFPVVDGVMAFPGWAAFEGADSADLDDAARDRIASGSVPVPEGVARGMVTLRDERRFDVPVLLVCPEFSPDEAKAWIDAGEIPELSQASKVNFVDIDSGHWPMVTQPLELAQIFSTAAG